MTRPPRTDPDTTAFVERVACDAAREGLPRIAGRIFGLLLVSERALSLDEIAGRLAASKGSISSDARRLEQRGVLERLSKPGDRRDYYQVPDDLFVRTMEMRLARWKVLHDAVDAGRRTLPAHSAVVRRRLDDFDAAFAFVYGAVMDALAQWHPKQQRRSPSRRSA
jgi:DNA-binding transcriptional regulator GbsR (MarR family)